MRTITKNCLNCQKIFEASLRETKRGNGKYCTQSCASIHTKSLKPKPKPNCICAFCKAEFYRANSKQLASKSGLCFCSRACKDAAQRLENNFKEIHPPHYSNGESIYREMALRNYPNQCNRCGYNKVPEILEVHHRDCNRDNNQLTNLELLCPNCHSENHFAEKTGGWKPR